MVVTKLFAVCTPSLRLTGFDALSFDISVSRPDLRREMEAEMKECVVGQEMGWKVGEDVVVGQ